MEFFVIKSTLLHCTIYVLKSLYLIHICILMSPKMHSQNRAVPYLLNILPFQIFAFSVLIGMHRKADILNYHILSYRDD